MVTYTFAIDDWDGTPQPDGYKRVVRVPDDGGPPIHVMGYSSVALCEHYISRHDPNSLEYLSPEALLGEFEVLNARTWMAEAMHQRRDDLWAEIRKRLTAED